MGIFSTAGHFGRKNIWVLFHEEPDLLFFVTKGLQELFAQLQVSSSLTYLDVCHLMIVPLRKPIEKQKKDDQRSHFIKLLSFSSPLPSLILSVPDNSKDLYILTAAAQHILTYNVLLRVLV